MRRLEAITAVHSGASITGTARRFGISRATLHRWLAAFDPAHPVSSLRPKQRGPKAPRWGDPIIDQVMKLIADHPDWWGKRRVAQALSERGLILSEATVGRILVVARQRLAERRQRVAREQEAVQRRQVRVTARRDQRDAERRALWQERLRPALTPGLPVEERIRRVAQALHSKGYKIQAKDLTPELRNIADTYLANFSKQDVVRPSEQWLIDADRWVRHPRQGVQGKPGPNIDHLLVGALNHIAKNYGPAACPTLRRPAPSNWKGARLPRPRTLRARA